jgi:hypothetical protein
MVDMKFVVIWGTVLCIVGDGFLQNVDTLRMRGPHAPKTFTLVYQTT